MPDTNNAKQTDAVLEKLEAMERKIDRLEGKLKQFGIVPDSEPQTRPQRKETEDKRARRRKAGLTAAAVLAALSVPVALVFRLRRRS